jgi:hypothetical protein
MTGGVQEAPHKAAGIISVSKGPAAESGDWVRIPVLMIKIPRIFPEYPLDDSPMLDMVIFRGTDGRTTGEAALFCIRGTQCRLPVILRKMSCHQNTQLSRNPPPLMVGPDGFS